MGQKVNPIGFRVGVIRTWDSRWYAKGTQYRDYLHEDIRLRKFVKDRLKHAGVSKIELERAGTSTNHKIKLVVSTARPGVVIGKKGAGMDALQADVQKLTPHEVRVSIQEVRKPDMDAQLVSENIAMQLEKRVSWRRAMKKALAAGVRSGVRGIKVMVAGRLDGAEIARSEWYTEKSVPLHTLRADIDYGFAEALTGYGIIGIKVWIYRGDVLSAKEVQEAGRVKSQKS